VTTADLQRQIGAGVRQARLSRGVTQEDLAQVLGVDRVTITRYENGSRPLPLAALLQIATFLEQPVSALLPAGDHPAQPEPPDAFADRAPPPTTSPPSEPEHPAVQHIVRVLTRHPDLIPTVLDLLETMLEADVHGEPAHREHLSG
jgi:transcriptional regulator with XRE-family HTH domain